MPRFASLPVFSAITLPGGAADQRRRIKWKSPTLRTRVGLDVAFESNIHPVGDMLVLGVAYIGEQRVFLALADVTETIARHDDPHRRFASRIPTTNEAITESEEVVPFHG